MIRLLTLALLLLLPVAAEAIQATITWSDDGLNPTRVERRDGPDSAPFVVVAPSIPAGVRSFNEGGLALSTRYCYRPVKFNAFGDAPTSPVLCGQADPANPASGVTIIFGP